MATHDNLHPPAQPVDPETTRSRWEYFAANRPRNGPLEQWIADQLEQVAKMEGKEA